MPAEGSAPRITLLGPQRRPRLKSVISGLGLAGAHFTTITTGWRDRESEDAVLVEELGGRTTNLRLWSLMQQLWEIDPELERADIERRAVLGEMQELYLIGLEQAAEAMQRLTRQAPRNPGVQEMAVQDALDIMRQMDAAHLRRVEELHQEFYDRWQPQHRDAVVTARFAVGRAIAATDAVVIPGGHVGVLLGALHVFNVAPALAALTQDESGAVVSTPRLHRPIIAWGAGAMALTERVLLFYDNSVVRPDVSEMLMRGLGLTRDVVALPSPRTRLDLKNQTRLRMLASRTAPAVPLLLEEHVEVTLEEDGRLPVGAPIIGPDGVLTTHEPRHEGAHQTAHGPADDPSHEPATSGPGETG